MRCYKLFFVILISFLSGCSMLDRKDQDPSALLEPSTTIKFTDVPVPAGFKLMPKDSYSFETTGTRVGMLKYQGKASADQVVAFYKEQMQMYNWNLLNTIEYGERQLNFDRDNETCIVTVTPRGSSAAFVCVTLGPKSQIAHKKAEKLVK